LLRSGLSEIRNRGHPLLQEKQRSQAELWQRECEYGRLGAHMPLCSATDVANCFSTDKATEPGAIIACEFENVVFSFPCNIINRFPPPPSVLRHRLCPRYILSSLIDEMLWSFKFQVSRVGSTTCSHAKWRDNGRIKNPLDI
jgi:hypothetical protein